MDDLERFAERTSLAMNTYSFWDNVWIDDGNACWPWLHDDGSDGVPQVAVPCWGEVHSTAELAWCLSHQGKIISVQNNCDDLTCCNPSHLVPKLPTASGKAAPKAVRKARRKAGSMASLTPKDIEWIRQLHVPGVYGYQRLADDFGVTKSTIRDVLARTKRPGIGMGNYSNCGKHKNHAKGEAVYQSKLTEQQVHLIRILAAGTLTRRQLAQMFGVEKGTIDAVVERRTWRHV